MRSLIALADDCSAQAKCVDNAAQPPQRASGATRVLCIVSLRSSRKAAAMLRAALQSFGPECDWAVISGDAPGDESTRLTDTLRDFAGRVTVVMSKSVRVRLGESTELGWFEAKALVLDYAHVFVIVTPDGRRMRWVFHPIRSRAGSSTGPLLFECVSQNTRVRVFWPPRCVKRAPCGTSPRRHGCRPHRCHCNCARRDDEFVLSARGAFLLAARRSGFGKGNDERKCHR